MHSDARGFAYPVEAEKPQPPLFEAKSPSIKCSMKYLSPILQSIKRSFARKEATIIRQRVCMYPVWLELTHCGVDDGVTGPSFAPCRECFLVILPLDIGVLRFEGLVHTTAPLARKSDSRLNSHQTNGPMSQDVLVKVSPRNLTDPCYDTLDCPHQVSSCC